MHEIPPLTIMLILVGWLFCFIVGDRNYDMQLQSVENIVFDYTQVAGKKGEMNQTIYEELNENLSRYGDFDVKMVAERFDKDTKTILEDDEIVDYDLRENDFDILTVYVESRKSHWVGVVLKYSILGTGTDDGYKLVGKSSVYIQ